MAQWARPAKHDKDILPGSHGLELAISHVDELFIEDDVRNLSRSRSFRIH